MSLNQVIFTVQLNHCLQKLLLYKERERKNGAIIVSHSQGYNEDWEHLELFPACGIKATHASGYREGKLREQSNTFQFTFSFDKKFMRHYIAEAMLKA